MQSTMKIKFHFNYILEIVMCDNHYRNAASLYDGCDTYDQLLLLEALLLNGRTVVLWNTLC